MRAELVHPRLPRRGSDDSKLKKKITRAIKILDHVQRQLIS